MAGIEMRPIDIDVLHNFSSSDSRQVPASGATVAIAREGATVTQSVACSASQDATVHVASVGRLLTGDLVSRNLTSAVLLVKEIGADGQTLTLRYQGSNSVTLAVGDRLACYAAEASATVGTAVTCLAQVITEVALRGPQVDDGVTARLSTPAGLVVDDIAGDYSRVSLSNLGAVDVHLAAGTPMLLDTGFMVFVVAAPTVCPVNAVTSVPMQVTTLSGGMVVFAGGDPAKALTVTSYDSESRTIELYNPGTSSIALMAESRLLTRASAPMYNDGSGRLQAESNVATLDGRGHAGFYTPEARVDAYVSGGGLAAPLLLPDRPGGWMRAGSGFLNAKDFPSIQDAIDALPQEGGTVYIPSGTYAVGGDLYTPCDRPCHLLGDGCAVPGPTATTLRWSPGAGETIAMLRVRGDNSSVRGLRLLNVGTTVPSGTDESVGYGILIGRRDVPDLHPLPGQASGTEFVKMGSTPTSRVVIEDVVVSGAQGWGLTIPGCGLQSNGDAEPGASTTGPTLSYDVSLRRVHVEYARKFGGVFVGGGCTTTWFEECEVVTQGADQASVDGNYYAYFSGCVKPVLSRCTFEGYSASGSATKSWIVFRAVESSSIENCWFEEDPRSGTTQYTPKYFVVYSDACRGGILRNCHFVRDGDSQGLLRAIQIEANGAHGTCIVEPFGIVTSGMLTTSRTAFLDTLQIDLGGDSNEGLTVIGSGLVRQATDTPPPNVYPIQYARVPATANLQGALLCKAPLMTNADLALVNYAQLATLPGNFVVNRDLGPRGGAVIQSPGTSGAWMLANNTPSMSTSARNAQATWSEGDVIYNTTAQELQILISGTWYTLWSKPC